MFNRSRPGWWGRVTAIASIVSAVIALLALLLGGGFVYTNWLNVPRLAYTILPIYKLQNQSFGGLVVENRGPATAHEISIRLTDLGSHIEQYSIESDEIWTLKDGGPGASHMTIWLDRMTGGSSLTIYLLTSEPIELDDIAVRAEEGPGHPAGAVSERESILSFLLGLVTVLIGSGSIVVFTRQRLRQVTERARPEVQPISFPYDFIDHFADAHQRGGPGSHIEPHLGATCEERSMRAIFEHPPTAPNEFSTLMYELVLPPGTSRLILRGFIGIETERPLPEGPLISERRPENSVQFEILINGKPELKDQKCTSKWEEFSIRVAREERLSICFRTNGLGDSTSNWAVWGEPRLVRVLEIRPE